MTDIARPAAGPLAETRRISAIDSARGFALLGIFLVNVHFFADALGAVTEPTPGDEISAANRVVRYATRALCEGKFYPLFSMLFGMGLMLQFQRFEARGGGFIGYGVRRLLVLLAIGVCHAVLIWYGDILVLYSLVGVLLLFMAHTRIRTLLWTGVGLLVLSLVLAGAFAAVMLATAPSATPPPVPAPADAPHFDDPFGVMWHALTTGELKDGPASPLWINTERQAYRDGPYDQLFKFRLLTWAMLLVIYFLGTGAHVAALFLFGAALLKAGLFEPERAPWRKRLILIGLCVGLPVCVLAAFLPRILNPAAGQLTAGFLNALFGPLLSLGYLTRICLLIDRGWCGRLTHALAMTGRMALTNYLTQSIVASFVFYYYGFGLFGRTSPIERVGIVFAIYLAQIAVSVFWMRQFRFGPMEWLWRSLTYLRFQPMRRRPIELPAE